MIDQVISFETAKLSRDKGFNICTLTCWIETKSPLFKSPFHTERSKIGYIKEGCNYINEPTQSLLQKWFREEHSIDVEAYSNASGYHWILSKSFRKNWFSGGTHIADSNMTGPNNGGGWDTFEGAMEAGLQNSLKLMP